MSSKKLEEIFSSGNLADLLLEVGDRHFKVHKVILAARSPVFASMFENAQETKDISDEVKVPDCDTEAFSYFLYFLYTGKFNVLSDKALTLYKLSLKFQVNDLKEKCAPVVIRALSIDTVFDVVKLATMYGQTDMLKRTTDFFIQNNEIIFQYYMKEWMEFMNGNPLVASALFQKIAKRAETKEIKQEPGKD